MRPGRLFTPVVSLIAVLAVSGCGVGFGAGEQDGSAELAITRDYGSEVLVSRTVDGLGQSSTAMRLLDGSTEIETRYGGGFVQSIDGISATAAARSSDWFYYVNGIAAERGAAEFLVGAGDRMWWDFRDWTDAMDINAVVGSYPAPMSTGYDGERWPVKVECVVKGEACGLVEDRVSSDGIETAGSESSGFEPGSESLRILVGEWAGIEADPDAARLGSAPAVSGVFARFVDQGSGVNLEGLDVTGEPAARFGAGTGLIAAVRKGSAPPVWVVTGTDREGVEAAAAALDEESLRNRYAVVVFDGEATGLPLTAETGEPLP